VPVPLKRHFLFGAAGVKSNRRFLHFQGNAHLRPVIPVTGAVFPGRCKAMNFGLCVLFEGLRPLLLSSLSVIVHAWRLAAIFTLQRGYLPVQ
jgi:hypothetical protein